MFDLKQGLRPCALASAVAIVFGLSGCGGGSGVKPSSSTPPPATGSGSGSGSSVVTVEAGTTLKVASGDSISKRIELKRDAVLDNAGSVGGMLDIAVEGKDSGATVLNHDGGSITADSFAVMMDSFGTVNNSSGGSIEGGDAGLKLNYGGSVSNDGANSIIRSPQGIAIQVLGQSGTVENTGGGTITSGSTTIYLEHGGKVTNASGSTIGTTGTAIGDCATVGVCSIFVSSDSQVSSSVQGELTLLNAGTIIGNVQMIPTASNSVTLTAGGSIHGDLGIGSRFDSFLTLNGDAGTVQLYSQAVTGTTTFAGDLDKSGDGTWIIDNNDLMADTVAIGGGTLQIGNGGTKGSIGQSNITIYHGTMVFNRSDDVTFDGDISSAHSEAYDGTLVQAGSGTLTLTGRDISPTRIEIRNGTLQVDNTGNAPGKYAGSYYFGADIVNDGALVFDSALSIFGGRISGTGSVTQNGSADLIFYTGLTYSGGTTINGGSLRAMEILPGNVTVNMAGTLDGFAGGPLIGVPGVAGDLSNAGRVLVYAGDSKIGGNYTQVSTGRLAVNLGSKLDVAGSATLNGGTLEVTGADSGYVSNAHTNVLTAASGVTGTFDQLVKDTGVVFTATTINYDANSVWLDTTGLNVTTAAAGMGVSYTPMSMASAQRVQGAFEQLNNKMATGTLSAVSKDFLHAAGQFQQAPSLQAAQASLQSLSGQLHAASAAMTFKAIDASSRALSDRFDNLLDKDTSFGTWMQNLNVGGDMARAGVDSVGFQLNGWLVGSDRKIGHSGVAGYAFGQSRGQQQLDRSFDHDHSRSTEGMLYAGWLDNNWYTQGRMGFGQFQQDVSRQLLLGESTQGVRTQYNGNYDVAYGESGLHFGRGDSHLTPFVNAEYARINRDGFAEQGAGGFGLRSGAQTLDRWQAGLGLRANRHWDLGRDRSVDFSARAQWQRTLASHGDVFNASFVGLQQWQPLIGVGLSRYSGLLGFGLNAKLSARTALKFSYDYEMGQRDQAQMLSARLSMAF